MYRKIFMFTLESNFSNKIQGISVMYQSKMQISKLLNYQFLSEAQSVIINCIMALVSFMNY